MNFSGYPVLKILFPLLIGIILGYFKLFDTIPTHFLLSFFGILLFLSLYLFRKINYNLQWIPGVLLQICFLTGGFISIGHRIHFSIKEDQYFTQTFDKQCNWIFHIVDQPVEKINSVKCVVRIIPDLTAKPWKEKAVVYFQKDERSLSLSHGDILFANTSLSLISPPQNPYAFNYKKYMIRRGVWFTGYVPAGAFHRAGNRTVYPIRQKAYRIQQFFSRQLALSGLEGDEYSILTAILLGNDDTMDPALRSSYASTGVSHILCVSGMHVGIIFMIVNFLLKPFGWSLKGRVVKTVLLLLTIWLYVLITGLSPSVQRAASMFSFVSLGNVLNRNINVFHSLFFSLFILLLINPVLLFETGFQLSYLAVFGIVLFQKPIFNLWKVKNKIIRYFWELASVSIAAQLCTSPISILYFGQFPNYFLLANLSVILLSFIVIISGIGVLIFSFSENIASFLGKVVHWEIRGMNTVISGIEKLPGAVTENLFINTNQVVLCYLLILCVYLCATQRKKIYFWGILFTSLLISFCFSYRRIDCKKEQSVTIYAIQRSGGILFNHHGQGILLLAGEIDSKKNALYRFSIQNHERERNIASYCFPIDSSFYNSELHFYKKESSILFQGISFFLLSGDQKLYPARQKWETHYLILRENPALSPESVSNTLKFKEVIMDGSISSYYEKKWIDFCIKENIQYHSTRQKGAKQIMIF